MKQIIILITTVLICSFSFGQRNVANYYSVKDISEQKVKNYLDNSEVDLIEGIWQSNDGFKYAIIKNNKISSDDAFQIIILSHNTNSLFWKESFVKGFIQKSNIIGVYNIDYYTAGTNQYSNRTNIEIQSCIGLLDASSNLLSLTRDDGDKVILIKMYPKENSSTSQNPNSDNFEISTGTGFAISSNGYIVTNHHVIENAQSIEVKGVNGNFIEKLKADLILTDKKNDLAIIKINDLAFSTLGSIPYTARLGVVDAGENIFVLGYPLISSMGEEVKLTNGIVSSKTGFQGDIASYQISAPIQPGNSGGPLFDKHGNLIGVINAKHKLAENASYAVKFSYVNNLIELLPQKTLFPKINLLNGKTLSEQVKIASNYTYLIVINENIIPNSAPKSKPNFKVSTLPHESSKYYTGVDKLNKSLINRKLNDGTIQYSIDQFVFDSGLDDILNEIQTNPELAEKLNDIGKKFFDIKLYNEAAAIYEVATSNPNSQNFLYDNFYLGYALYFGNVNLPQGQKIDPIIVEKASKAFENVIAVSPTTQDAYIYKARVNSLLENNTEAQAKMVTNYEEFIKVVTEKGEAELAKPANKTKFVEAYINLGTFYVTSDKAKAKELFQKALAIEPTNEVALARLKALK